MVCGDCGSPMFPMSRSNLKEAYRCGEYHKRGVKACTSHHIRVEVLDAVVKEYLRMIRDTSTEMIERLQQTIAEEESHLQTTNNTLEQLEEMIADTKAEKRLSYDSAHATLPESQIRKMIFRKPMMS